MTDAAFIQRINAAYRRHMESQNAKDRIDRVSDEHELPEPAASDGASDVSDT